MANEIIITEEQFQRLQDIQAHAKRLFEFFKVPMNPKIKIYTAKEGFGVLSSDLNDLCAEIEDNIENSDPIPNQ